MSIAITATGSRVIFHTRDGVPLSKVGLTVTGLTAGAANAISVTSDGTSGGTPLLGANAKLAMAPNYIPTDTAHILAWAESAVPDTDSAGNVRLHLEPAASGPTSFRIDLIYGTP